jgi:hypothetical protein
MAKFDPGTPVKLLGGQHVMTVVESSEQTHEAKCRWHDDTDRVSWIPEGILREVRDEAPSS